jgi:ribosomal protein S18
MASHDLSIDRDAHQREIDALECVSGALSDAMARLEEASAGLSHAKTAFEKLAYRRSRTDLLDSFITEVHGINHRRERVARTQQKITAEIGALRSELNAVYDGTGEVI